MIGLIGFMRISSVLETRSSVMYGLIEFRFLRSGKENRYNCGVIIIFSKRKTKNRHDKIVVASNSQSINFQIIRRLVSFSFAL